MPELPLNPTRLKQEEEKKKLAKTRKPTPDPVLKLFHSPYKRWNYKETPIKKLEDVPKDWNSHDNDIDER
jgi:hypothetical protein